MMPLVPLVRSARYLMLALLLMMTQQFGFVHGYGHTAELAAHAHDQGEAPHESVAACLDCVALAGTGPTPITGAIVPAAAPHHPVLSAGAVPPAPTFAYRTAFDSRAPPRLLS
jgi:hypothetical protein